MNAILYTVGGDVLTKEEETYFQKAEKIIYNSNNNNHKKHIIWTIIVSILFVLFMACAILSTMFAVVHIKKDTIAKGINVLGIDISYLTKEEALKKLQEEAENRLSTDVVFKHNEQTYTLLPVAVNSNYDLNAVVDEAYKIGRDINIFKDNFEVVSCLIKAREIAPTFSYNSDAFGEATQQMNENLADKLEEVSYNIEENNLIIHNGKNGNIVDIDSLKARYLEKLTNAEYNQEVIEVPVIYKQASKVDIDKIHNEIYKEAKDASFRTEPYAVFPSSNGVDFAISIDEAKSMITGEAESYTIPLKTLYPNVKTSDIGNEAFPNTLASYSSNYATSNSNRSTNIALASSKINGLVMMPGDVFSFNDTVGKRTPQAGFKVAGVYVNGQVTNDYGGGICQVSSTLYNAVLRANLEIVYRTNHQFVVGYVPISTDATVSWGAPDFKFKNSRNYPIKIVVTNSNKNIYVKILGLHEENEYDVEIISYRTGTVPFKTTYTKDKSLASGQTKVIQAGSNGARSEAYRILKQNGKEVSRELLGRDVYSPHNQVIAVGQ